MIRKYKMSRTALSNIMYIFLFKYHLANSNSKFNIFFYYKLKKEKTKQEKKRQKTKRKKEKNCKRQYSSSVMNAHSAFIISKYALNAYTNGYGQ